MKTLLEMQNISVNFFNAKLSLTTLSIYRIQIVCDDDKTCKNNHNKY